MLNPETSNGQASETVRQCRPTWANGDGIEVARCGSLDKIALPLSVREPATAQELEPVPAWREAEPSPGIARLIFAIPSKAFVALRN